MRLGRILPCLAFLTALAASACQILTRSPPEPTVSVRIKGNVPDAQVTIDDVPVGALAFVAARGVAVHRGTHRITVEKTGYFPWDSLIEAQSAPVLVQVNLVPIPD